MIPIGRFAQLTGLTVRALRHYESQGLLMPARVDRESGYRYYAPEQLAEALHVRLLRAHRARVATRVAELGKLLERLDEWLDGAPEELLMPGSSLDESSASTVEDSHRADENVARTFLELFGPADEI